MTKKKGMLQNFCASGRAGLALKDLGDLYDDK